MFEGLWRKKECEVCKIFKLWNESLQEQNSILQHRISDLQDEINRRAAKLADDKSKLEDVILGRKNGQQPPPKQIQFQPIRKHVDWKTERSKLEKNSKDLAEEMRARQAIFVDQMKKAEEKGILPKEKEDL